MKHLRFLSMLIFLAFCSSSLEASETLTKEKRTDIDRLLEMTQVLEIGQQMSSVTVLQMSQVIKAARPDIPQELLDALSSIVSSVITDNLSTFKESMMVIYDKYFSADEVKEMIRFYSTNLGQKTLRIMPSLMQEGFVAGQQWAESLRPDIERRIRARFKEAGIDL